ncbi:4-hydroxythreonine-4-phosphate dehydrogenase PdxA [Pelagibacterales bacterium SAG-MED38]|nr:4-hydroxythreonine-4-phosphate dehydrogenase PdxA [Pelagibacterales bacterium SAG-MED38]
MNSRPILIIPGETKSIFFEIFFKSLKLKKFNSSLILICNKKKLDKEIKMFGFKKNIELLDILRINPKNIKKNKIYLIDVKNYNSNNYIFDSFDIAFKLIKSGFTNKLINGPVDKSKTLKKKYLGITEYISRKFNRKKFAMLIYNEKLSVCPVTTHLPLKLVTKEISKRIIKEKVNIINDFYKNFLKFKPRIGVVGLNPHCESIHNFNEDEKILLPVIKSLKKKINVKGPFPADTIFLKKNRKNFDVIVGMYHDQVLAPIKTIFEYNAINITLGLPFIRVSPDHGPNKKMIGKNKSSPTSLIRALSFLDKR